MSTVLVWFIVAFLNGSLPFSVWVGRIGGKNIQQYGDGNPGATNVWKAGGPFWGGVAMILDFSKGAVPILATNFVIGFEGLPLALVAMSPILGHAYSPFLRLKGGKALAVTFGVWTGLSLWLVPTVLGVSLALWIRVLKNDGRAVLAGMVTILVLFLIIDADGAWYLVWVGNTLILAWKYRRKWLPENKPHLNLMSGESK